MQKSTWLPKSIWSDTELQILRDNYPYKLRNEMLALLPNKKWTSIRHKVSELHLLRTFSGIWRQEEIDALKTNWADNGRPKILSLLPLKDWSSIRHKAFEFGLAKKAFAKYWRTYDKTASVILSEADRGYLAGIMDGEGTLRVMRALKKWYAPFIQITNTDKVLMDWLQQILGVKGIGCMYYEGKRKNPKHKPKYVYNIASVQGVKQILEQTIDILKIKHRQAILLLEFISLKEEKADYGVLPREKEIFEELTKLNRRGVSVAE